MVCTGKCLKQLECVRHMFVPHLGFGNLTMLSSYWLEMLDIFQLSWERNLTTPLSVRHDLVPTVMSCSFAMSTLKDALIHVETMAIAMAVYKGTGWHIVSRRPGDFRSWVLTRLIVENCQCDKLLEVFRETKDTKSLTSAHAKGPFNNPFLSFPFPSSCHKAEAQANERREVPEHKNPGRDGRPGLTYGFSYIREAMKRAGGH